MRPSKRGELPGPAGLPGFCRQKHFNRAANAYVVPLWEVSSSWLPEELKPYEVARKRESFSPEKRRPNGENGARNEDDEDSEDEELLEDPTESEQSEVAWEGPLGGSSRAWFRGVVDTALVLLRRLQGDAGTYAVGVSAALIPPETVGEGNDASMDRCLAQVCRLREPRWAVMALRSGHFAGAIFHGQESIIHKALHRYTVRAKAGGAQSACDGGKKVKSVGSSLRRHGEQRLAEDIKELLTVKWAEELSACELILVSVSKRMKSTLLGTEKEPFLPEPHRIRKLPFMMGKPTFEAVKSAYFRAASLVFCEEKVAEVMSARFNPREEPEKPSKLEKPPEKVPEKEPEAAPEPVKYCEEEDPLFTALHAAALADDVDQIWEELEEGGDPTARDSKGRVAYYLCSSAGAREAFRRWRGQNEEAWEWEKAQVPEGITEASEQRKREKEKEKKKKQKEKQKANKAKAKEEEEERLRKEAEEKRQLEEARVKCDKCQTPITAKPFSRLNYLYCSFDCSNQHRRDLQAEAALKRLG